VATHEHLSGNGKEKWVEITSSQQEPLRYFYRCGSNYGYEKPNQTKD
jgi:hypothetical protein